MARFLIIDASAGIGEGAIEVPIVAEVHLRDEKGEEVYLSLDEFTGIPNFFKTEKSTYEMLMSARPNDEGVEYLNAHYVPIEDYVDVFDNPEEEYYDALRYLVFLVRSEMDEAQEFIDETTGHWTDEIDIPMSDIEEEWREEMESEAEEDEDEEE